MTTKHEQLETDDHHEPTELNIIPGSIFYDAEATTVENLHKVAVNEPTHKFEGAQGAVLAELIREHARQNESRNLLTQSMTGEPITHETEMMTRGLVEKAISGAAEFLDTDPEGRDPRLDVIAETLPVDSPVTSSVLRELEQILQAKPIGKHGSDGGRAFTTEIPGVRLDCAYFDDKEGRTFVSLSLRRAADMTPAHEILQAGHEGTDASEHPSGAYYLDLASQLEPLTGQSHELAALTTSVRKRAEMAPAVFSQDTDPAIETKVRTGVETAVHGTAEFLAELQAKGLNEGARLLLEITADDADPDHDPAVRLNDETKAITREIEHVLGVAPDDRGAMEPRTDTVTGQRVSVLTKKSQLLKDTAVKYVRIPGNNGQRGKFEVWVQRKPGDQQQSQHN